MANKPGKSFTLFHKPYMVRNFIVQGLNSLKLDDNDVFPFRKGDMHFNNITLYGLYFTERVSL